MDSLKADRSVLLASSGLRKPVSMDRSLRTPPVLEGRHSPDKVAFLDTFHRVSSLPLTVSEIPF